MHEAELSKRCYAGMVLIWVSAGCWSSSAGASVQASGAALRRVFYVHTTWHTLRYW
jgi:hypothetical protein